ncbi:hypothetical protein SASPL_104800 [Salvia splendens]|uniref:MADS-box domain-containing protein n=2 Tax=Salvia splendens TaxID=180675 RepID=A0A8X8YMC6_SALSN|nr:hypothetical protein SASPL_104800 [Salvia splendens]
MLLRQIPKRCIYTAAALPEPRPWLFVGLGNPGDKFMGTRHNVGFEFIDAFAKSHGIAMDSVHCKAIFGKGTLHMIDYACAKNLNHFDFVISWMWFSGIINMVPVFLSKPQTYMNLSGESSGPLAAYYKLPLNRVLVLHDDMTLPCGVLRLNPLGNHGSHNGMKSVINHFRGNREFPRLRIGIGRPAGQMDPKAFLLQKFNVRARERIDAALQEGVDTLTQVLSKGLTESARCFNKEQKYKHLRLQTMPLSKMGRAKLKMELIEKEKSRNTTFKKRKEGLIRKLSEFTTLCDVKACMIIYGPNQTRPEIWPPQDPEEVRRFIDLYKSKSSGSVRKSGVVEFFNERKRQIEDELKKLKRKNQEAKYPTRPELLNVISEHQLRHLHAELTDKARCVRSRIELLKMKQRPQTEQNAMLMDHRRLHPSPVMVGIGSSNAANMQMKRQIYYESASGFYQSWPQYMVQPPLPLPPLPPQQPYLLQAMVQPQMQFLGNQEEMMMMRNQAVRAHNLNQDGVKYEDFTNNRMFSC